MKHFAPILVVEGASDKAFISTFLEADFVITNGSEVSRETIDYLKEAKKTRDIVVLTDPDSPGKRIRDILDQNIPGLMHAFVPKEHSIKHNKVGVAESTEYDVMNALSHIVPSKNVKKGNLTPADFNELGLSGGLNSKEKRDIVAKKLHLGFGNAKTLLQRANALGISKEQLKEALK